VAGPLEARVVAALAAIRNPRLENDLLSAGMIRDLVVSDQGAVQFTFLLAPEDPATLVRQARAAVQAVDGVRREDIKITVTNPAGPVRATHGPPPTPGPASADPVGAEQPNLGRIIAVSSGKGGVGKSTVAVNVAAVRVAVFNGSGVNQRAASIKTALTSGGFTMATVGGTVAKTPTTKIYYPSGRSDSAAAVAHALGVPSANVVQSTTYTEVTVVIGADWSTGNTYPGGASSTATPAG